VNALVTLVTIFGFKRKFHYLQYDVMKFCIVPLFQSSYRSFAVRYRALKYWRCGTIPPTLIPRGAVYRNVHRGYFSGRTAPHTAYRELFAL
jgi:hypothetical protein